MSDTRTLAVPADTLEAVLMGARFWIMLIDHGYARADQSTVDQVRRELGQASEIYIFGKGFPDQE